MAKPTKACKLMAELSEEYERFIKGKKEFVIIVTPLSGNTSNNY
jgi:hypothetical protein